MARTGTQGTTVRLYIEVRDIYGVLVDSDFTPLVSVFPFDADPRVSWTQDTEALILDDVAIREAQGLYYYEYLIDIDAHTGVWFDRWKVSIDNVESLAVLQFTVTQSSPVTDIESIQMGNVPLLLENNVIVVTLSDTIRATDGSFLVGGCQYYFTTQYNPLYSSVRRVRLRAGRHLNNVPDDTINLAIFEASLYADDITFGMVFPPLDPDGYPGISYQQYHGTPWKGVGPAFYGIRTKSGGAYLSRARIEFTTCMAVHFILSNNLGQFQKRKRLGDFEVEYGDNSLKVYMDDLHKECKDWEAVLNSGGYLTQGASPPFRKAFNSSQQSEINSIRSRYRKSGL
jgi:hypothetical protein